MHPTSYLLLWLFLGLLAGCATGPVASKNWPKHECGNIPGVEDASYCYDESAPGATDVLFFFHGLKDSKEVWVKPTSVPSDYPALIAAMPAMRIITISFGDGWLLTNYPARSKVPRAATLDNFRGKILPYLENKYGLKPPYKGLSHSMGGANLAVLWAAYPEMWKSVTLLNPAMITKATDPWDFLQICPWCLMVKANFDNRKQWNAGSPIGLVDAANPGLPPIHITACESDLIFWLYDGTKEFRNHAKVKSNSVDWHDGEPGCSHWNFDVPWVMRSLR